MTPLKPIGGDPLRAFLLWEFTEFAKRWPIKKDLERLAISFGVNGHLLVGGEDTLSAIFVAAAFPESVKSAGFSALFVSVYGRAPDFVLASVISMREKLAKASPHRRRLLFQSSSETPKTAWANLTTGKRVVRDGSGTVKAERRKLREKADKLSRSRTEALKALGFPSGVTPTTS